MTAVVITSSSDPSFVRPLATLRGRGIGCVVVLLDRPAFARDPDPDVAEHDRQRMRAVRHALAEFELPTFVVMPHQPLEEALVS
jgi:hypothetical protein